MTNVSSLPSENFGCCLETEHDRLQAFINLSSCSNFDDIGSRLACKPTIDERALDRCFYQVHDLINLVLVTMKN
jgi:hypothetical protein